MPVAFVPSVTMSKFHLNDDRGFSTTAVRLPEILVLFSGPHMSSPVRRRSLTDTLAMKERMSGQMESTNVSG